MTPTKFLASFLSPPSPLSVFHTTFQYSLFAKLGDFSTSPISVGCHMRMVPNATNEQERKEIQEEGKGEGLPFP